MNCLDVRRLCLVEPHSRDPRLYLHLYHCPACRKYRKQVLQGEQKVQDAMHVPVPEGLGKKIAFDQAMNPPRSKGFTGWGSWQSVAAGVVMGIGLGIGLIVMNARPDVVVDLAMHMADDPLHMAPAQSDAEERLDKVMRHLGGHWSGEKPAVTHATVCLVREHAAAHLVVKGQQGPVTVFLLPRMQSREHELLPVDGQLADVNDLHDGSIALFGYEGEDLDRIERQFAEAIQWSPSIAKQTSSRFLAVR